MDMSAISLATIKRETGADPDLITLKQYINDGFPQNKADCLESEVISIWGKNQQSLMVWF